MNIFLKIVLIIMFFPFAMIYYIVKFTIKTSRANEPKRARRREILRQQATLYSKNNRNKVNYSNPYINAVPKHIYAETYLKRKTNKYPCDYIVFDTETTGLEPEIDKIIELSAIKYINHHKVSEFSFLVNPRISIDPFITQLTGIKNSDLRGKPTIDIVLKQFFEWCEDFTLIAHNAPYDIKMIACECYRNNIPMLDNKVIDTVTLAKRIFDKSVIGNYKLTTIKEYFGLAYNSHRALDDCEICSALYQHYCDVKGL